MTHEKENPFKPKNNAGENTGSSTVMPARSSQSPLLTQKNFNDMSVGAYAHDALSDFSAVEWEKEKANHQAKPWADSPEGRLAIRTFSRGILGAAFFTTGGLFVRKWMHTAEYNPYNGLMEQKNPLQFMAKLIDTVAGKPIELTVNMLGGNGKNAVRFRPTMYAGYKQDGHRGRSLGAESVAITFDFFMASIGDAFGRDVAGWFDPNVKKDWMKEGHIDFPKAIKQAMNSAWLYLSYNGGEDWAVAIPYAYYMKGQRKLINHFSPGFMYDFDRGLNGASFKIDKKGNLTGNYNVEGALDLQGRFTVYNIGTLLYREAYSHAADWMRGNPTPLYGSSQETDGKPKGFLQGMGELMKWAARGAVKGTIYMTPAVPFFWITRTPQGKHRGLAINPETGPLAFKSLNAAGLPVYNCFNANEHTSKNVASDTPVFLARYDSHADQWKTPVKEISNPFTRSDFDPYGKTFGMFDRALNFTGRINYEASKKLDRTADLIDRNMGALSKRMVGLEPKDREFRRFTRPFINASASYTPYMYMKAETSRRWDTGKMDTAVERAIDGVTKFDWREFKEGCGEIWHAFRRQPFDDPERESYAQRRILDDRSATDANSVAFTEEVQEARESYLKHLQLRKEDAKVRLQHFRADREKTSHVERLQAEPGLKVKEPAPRIESYATHVSQNKDDPTINHTIH